MSTDSDPSDPKKAAPSDKESLKQDGEGDKKSTCQGISMLWPLNTVFPLLDEEAQWRISQTALLEAVAAFSLADAAALARDPDFTAKEAAGSDSKWGWGLTERLSWCRTDNYDWFTCTQQEGLLGIAFGETGEQWLRSLFCPPSHEDSLRNTIIEMGEVGAEILGYPWYPKLESDIDPVGQFLEDWRSEILSRLARKIPLPRRADIDFTVH